MKKIIVIGLLILFNFFTTLAQNNVRPNECWVRRSVLDKRARIIDVDLNKDLYVAYDGNNCGIFKIWKGGVNFSGAVWDSKHGPQPVSLGKPFTEGILDEQIWFLQKAGLDVPTKVNFKGYIWKNNSVTFKYELVAENKTVLI